MLDRNTVINTKTNERVCRARQPRTIDTRLYALVCTIVLGATGSLGATQQEEAPSTTELYRQHNRKWHPAPWNTRARRWDCTSNIKTPKRKHISRQQQF
jgi:hypothetical protein